MRHRTTVSPFFLFLLLVVVVLDGCDGPNEPGRDEPVPQAATLKLLQDHIPLYFGDSLAIAYVVLDEKGDTLKSPAIRFGITVPDVAGVDSVGMVTARSPGYAQVQIEVDRPGMDPLIERIGVHVFNRHTLKLSSDSITVATLGCAGSLLARVHELYRRTEMIGQNISYTVEDSSIVMLSGTATATGTYRGHLRNLHALRAGTTRVFAAFKEAVDTAVVTVRSDLPTGFGFEPAYSPRELAPRDTATLRAVATYTGCGMITGPPPVYPVATPEYRSVSPAIASVDDAGHLTVHSLGDVSIIADWGELSDTLNISVKDWRIEPADTTIAVGDTVVYSVYLRDSTGREEEALHFTANPADRSVAATLAPPNSRAVEARGAGVTQVRFYVLGRFRHALLRVTGK